MRIGYFIGLVCLHLLLTLRISRIEGNPVTPLTGLMAVTTSGAALILAGVKVGRLVFLLSAIVQGAIFAVVSVAALVGTGLLAVGGSRDAGDALVAADLTSFTAIYLLIGLLFYGRSDGRSDAKIAT